ncbi:MAG: hypothetical protein C0623_05815 [Desulfuromonas sp.]|nr:MAG: hypothetical protein C0623_05815 [Desulfuromonas sp.]
MVEWRKLRCCLGIFTLLLLLIGCTTGRPETGSKKAGAETGEEIVAISQRLLGSPYRYGGTTPAGFDCSGLVHYVYRQVGINVPRSSRRLYQKARKVSLKNLQPGDLLFFKVSRNKVSHVAIYSGKGRFIHAPSSGKQVSAGRLDNPYWDKRLIGAGRFH